MTRFFAIERESLWRLLALVGGALAYLKGFRLPSLYVATENQLTYEHGLVKRGLFGSICNALNIPIQHYDVMVAVAFALAAIVVALFAIAVWKARLFEDELGLAGCVVFLSSYAVTYFAHLVGRMDTILLGLTLCVITIRSPLIRFLVLLVTAPIAALLHEMFLLIFLPACLLPGVLDMLEAKRLGEWLRRGAVVVLPAAACLAVVMVVASHGVSQAQSAAIQWDISRRIDFAPGSAPWVTISLGFDENMAIGMRVMSKPDWPWKIFASTLIFLPAAAFLLAVAVEKLKSAGALRLKLAAFAVIAAAAAPICMNRLGSDTHRWHTHLVLAAFCALLVVALRARPQADKPADVSTWRGGAILLMALNLSAGGVLLDQAEDTPYPFVQHMKSAVSTLTSGHITQPDR